MKEFLEKILQEMEELDISSFSEYYIFGYQDGVEDCIKLIKKYLDEIS